MKNILIISPGKRPTGSEFHSGNSRSCYEIGLGLNKRGYNIHFMSGEDSEVEYASSLTHYDSLESNANEVLSKILIKLPIDIIIDSSQFHKTDGNFETPRINRMAGYHSSCVTGSNMIVNSNFMKQKLGAKFCIPTAIYEPDLNEYIQSKYYRKILYASRKSSHKGWHIVQELINRGMPIDTVSDLPRSEYLELLTHYEYLLHPSLLDAAPRAPMEAALLGVPTLCLNQSGTQESVIDGKTGYVATNIDELEMRCYQPRTLQPTSVSAAMLKERDFNKMVTQYEAYLQQAYMGAIW